MINICFIDLGKAFDRVSRGNTWKVLDKRGIDGKIINCGDEGIM